MYALGPALEEDENRTEPNREPPPPPNKSICSLPCLILSLLCACPSLRSSLLPPTSLACRPCSYSGSPSVLATAVALRTLCTSRWAGRPLAPGRLSGSRRRAPGRALASPRPGLSAFVPGLRSPPLLLRGLWCLTAPSWGLARSRASRALPGVRTSAPATKHRQVLRGRL